MKKIIVFVLFIFLPFYAKAVTMDEYREALAEVGISAGTTYQSEFVYSYFYGGTKDNPINLKSSTTNKWLANGYKGITSTGYKYGFKGNPGVQGSFTNKFAVYCESFVQLMIYHASGGKVSYGDYQKVSTSELKKGDLIHFDEPDNHIAIYIDDNNDDNPKTFNVAHASAGTASYVLVNRHSDYGKALNESSLANLNYNTVTSSYDFHDRLDDSPPIINSVTQVNNKVLIQATDYKNYSLSPSNDLLEPENFGITHYALTTSSVEPTTWSILDKTDHLNAEVGDFTSNGLWYIWIKDVGGNVAYQTLNVSNIDTVKPTLGNLIYKTTNDSITVTINDATDNQGAVKYSFYLDNKLIVTQDSNVYTFSNLLYQQSYIVSYDVVDISGNIAKSMDNEIVVKSTIDSLSFTHKNVVVAINNQQQLSIVVSSLDNNYIVSYKSDNTSVVTVDDNGKIIGKSIGVANITVSIGDITDTCTVEVREQLLFLTNTMNVGVINEDYNMEILVSDSNATFSIVSGQLPEGLLLNANGVISGIPINSGIYGVIIQATSHGLTVEKTFNVSIVEKSGVSTISIILIVSIVTILLVFIKLMLVFMKKR